MAEQPFWNLTEGRRPTEPYPDCFADLCQMMGSHVYDSHYGPDVCARCGYVTKHDLMTRVKAWLSSLR
jgi:hypothetical protein